MGDHPPCANLQGQKRESILWLYRYKLDKPSCSMCIWTSLTHCFKGRQCNEVGTSRSLSLGPSWFLDVLHHRLLESRTVISPGSAVQCWHRSACGCCVFHFLLTECFCPSPGYSRPDYFPSATGDCEFWTVQAISKVRWITHLRDMWPRNPLGSGVPPFLVTVVQQLISILKFQQTGLLSPQLDDNLAT